MRITMKRSLRITWSAASRNSSVYGSLRAMTLYSMILRNAVWGPLSWNSVNSYMHSIGSSVDSSDSSMILMNAVWGPLSWKRAVNKPRD